MELFCQCKCLEYRLFFERTVSFSNSALTLGADVLRKVPSNMPKYPDINHFLLEFGWVLLNRNSWIWVVLKWSYKKLSRGVCHYQIWLVLHMCHQFEISPAWRTGSFQPGSCIKSESSRRVLIRWVQNYLTSLNAFWSISDSAGTRCFSGLSTGQLCSYWRTGNTAVH